MEIGFTTGRFDKISLEKKIDFFGKLGCTAIEVGWFNFEGFEKFDKLFSEVNLNQFSYRSMHAPVRIAGELLVYQNDQTTREILEGIEKFIKKYQIQTVVLHPDRVKDWSVFEGCSIPFAIENMDNRKEVGRTVKDLDEYFKLFNAGFVIDVNHVCCNDNTLKLFTDFFVNFQNRLKHFHLSGYSEYHELLSETKQTAIIDLVKDKNLPIIIESTCESLADYENEYKYITDYLNS